MVVVAKTELHSIIMVLVSVTYKLSLLGFEGERIGEGNEVVALQGSLGWSMLVVAMRNKSLTCLLVPNGIRCHGDAMPKVLSPVS